MRIGCFSDLCFSLLFFQYKKQDGVKCWIEWLINYLLLFGMHISNLEQNSMVRTFFLHRDAFNENTQHTNNNICWFWIPMVAREKNIYFTFSSTFNTKSLQIKTANVEQRNEKEREKKVLWKAWQPIWRFIATINNTRTPKTEFRQHFEQDIVVLLTQ